MRILCQFRSGAGANTEFRSFYDRRISHAAICKPERKLDSSFSSRYWIVSKTVAMVFASNLNYEKPESRDLYTELRILIKIVRKRIPIQSLLLARIFVGLTI